MASFNKNALGSDDEDDLESLRLAALKSLKPKQAPVIYNKPPENIHCKPLHSYKQPSTFGAAQTTRHHNRGFRNSSGRSGRNGICSRSRTNTNLISIQTIDQTETKEITAEPVCVEVPKLILPQDRYHKPQLIEDSKEKENVCNKFNRYDDNSEESESDSDEQVIKPSRRERKDSLEALMDELENEINEGDKKGEQIITATEANKSSTPDDETNDNSLERVSNSDDLVTKTNDEVVKEANDTLIISNDSDLVQIDEEIPSSPVKTEKPKNESLKEKTLSPVYRRSPYMPPERSHVPINKRKSRSRSPHSRSRSPRRSRSPCRKVRYSPGHYSRPLSPLTLNTDVLNTITMAPLSPRSAAFVLENRQILARRQMSPRRSSSRGSSCRRSISPKRGKMSPRRRSRSRSRSLRRKCSLSPRKRSTSPRSPKRRSSSPRNNHHHRRSPISRLNKRNSNSPVVKQPVHKRLGSKNTSPHYEYDRKPEILTTKRKRASRSISLSLSPSPDRNYHKRPLNETTGHVNVDVRRQRDKMRKDSPSQSAKAKEGKLLDPVIEARRRKFESPVKIGNNGVIKLKSSRIEEQSNEFREPFEESQQQQEDHEEEEEDRELEDEEIDDSVLDLNPTLDDLWSEEESDDENEGRFKSKTSSQRKNVSTISFRNLTEKSAPKDPLLPKENSNYRSDRKYKRQKNYPRRRSRSPLKVNINKPENSSKSSREVPSPHRDSKSKLKSTSNNEKIQSKSLEDDRKKEKSSVKTEKIEISATKNPEVLKTLQTEKNIRRKVKIQKVVENILPDSNVENDEEPEIIIENEDDPILNKDDDGGDLRAELSRRRAQRLIKAGSLAGSLPARLLKNALQEVVPKRSAIKAASKTVKGGASSADRRVLILKRLASSPAPQLEPANKVAGTKEGKLPIHMRLGSSNAADVYLEEGAVRVERKPKRVRSGRRKKQAVQV